MQIRYCENGEIETDWLEENMWSETENIVLGIIAKI